MRPVPGRWGRPAGSLTQDREKEEDDEHSGGKGLAQDAAVGAAEQPVRRDGGKRDGDAGQRGGGGGVA